MCEDCGLHSGESDHSHSHSHGNGHSHERENEQSSDGATAAETDETVRLAVTGKGGVGKSTLSAAIARHLAAHHDLVAIDADPDMNLASTLDVEEPVPVTEQKELIEERAGGGGLITLTPDVEDVLDSHSTAFGAGGRLLTIGSPAAANTGCMCPENSFVRSLVSSALDEDYVVMDMEAGIEHLGRGTADAVDAMLVVVEPSRAAIDTANRIHTLADDLDVDDVVAVVNKARGNVDVVRDALDLPVIATIPYDENVATAALTGESPVVESQQLQRATAEVISAVLSK